MAPNSGDLAMLQEMLGIPGSQAMILLEKYFNVEQAVNQYFEDPVNSIKPQAPQNQWEPADNIPYADDTTELPAMSRPPSRVDNRPVNARIDAVQTGAIPIDDDMQDIELQKAIAASKQDFAGQETGVAEARPQFGPANRPYYDASQWAMTTIASSREIVDHPPPPKRQRLSGQPAFLRGSSDTGYLAPLLNIYHSIPLAREAFLLPSMRVLSYGHDPQWWSGSSDENTKSISVEASDGGGQDRQNFLSELQCLMAFLDHTDRAYGSVDALSDLRAMKAYNSGSPLSQLLEAWTAASMIECPDNQLTQIFTSTAIKAPGMEGYGVMQRDFVCREQPVLRSDTQTLIAMLDSTIWGDVDDNIDDIWIHQCAEVFTMRLHKEGDKGLGLEIPATWYPDKYMYEYREITRQWRQETLAIWHEISQCKSAQRRCEVLQGPGKKIINIRDVLEAAAKLSKPEFDSTEILDEGVTEVVPESPESTRAEEMRNQLHTILQTLDQKVKLLEERKTELQQQIRSITSRLTQPDPNSELSPRHKYYLQGVSTKPNITYVRQLKRQRQPLIDTESETDASDHEWWRIVWGQAERIIPPSARPIEQQKTQQAQPVRNMISDESVVGEEAYSVHVVDEAEVLEAAKTENNSVVLVYANENAMNFTPSPMSPALRKFVEQDNRSFQKELNLGQVDGLRRSSEDTNTTIMEDIPFDDRSVTPNDLREMTPMSITSPRDADGQPSPKRPKGDEAYSVYRETDSESDPPPYEEGSNKLQMTEKKGNKIGILADQMLEKYGGDGVKESEADGPVHIEHAREPLR